MSLKTWIAGEKLTAADLNANFVEVLALGISPDFNSGEAFAVNKAIIVKSDSKVYLSDASDSGLSKFVGFSKEAATGADESKTIQIAGVVTGFSGLTAGSYYYLQDAVIAIDQNQESQNGGESTNNNWQSFKTGVGVTTISKIGVMMDTGSPVLNDVTITLREGTGTGGTSLGSKTGRPSSGQSSYWFELTFDTPITVSAETTYTIHLTGSINGNWRIQRSNVYADGRSSVNSSYDFTFRVYAKSGLGDIGDTPGTNSVKVGLATSATELLIINGG